MGRFKEQFKIIRKTKMKTTILKTVFTIGILFHLLPAKAQVTQFSGTWKLKERTSLTGLDYANGVPTQEKVTAASNEITIERTVPTGNADQPESVTSETLKINNQVQNSTTPRGRIRRTTFTFDQATRTFTISSDLAEPQKPDKVIIKLKEVWTVAPDGQTLTLLNYYESVTDPTTSWSMKGIYQKQ